MTKEESRNQIKQQYVWFFKSKPSFEEQIIFVPLLDSVGKNNLEIDLTFLFNEYRRAFIEIADAFNEDTPHGVSPSARPRQRLEPDVVRSEAPIEKTSVVNFDAKHRKMLTKAFKRLVKKGFLEIKQSQSWKIHTVNVIPVWDK